MQLRIAHMRKRTAQQRTTPYLLRTTKVPRQYRTLTFIFIWCILYVLRNL